MKHGAFPSVFCTFTMPSIYKLGNFRQERAMMRLDPWGSPTVRRQANEVPFHQRTIINMGVYKSPLKRISKDDFAVNFRDLFMVMLRDGPGYPVSPKIAAIESSLINPCPLIRQFLNGPERPGQTCCQAESKSNRPNTLQKPSVLNSQNGHLRNAAEAANVYKL